MRAKQESVIKERERQLAKKNAEARLMEQQKEDKKRKEQRKVCYDSLSLYFCYLGLINSILSQATPLAYLLRCEK